MTFQKLKVDELKQLAVEFGVIDQDNPQDKKSLEEMTKKELLVALEENGVTWSYYQNSLRSKSKDDSPDAESDVKDNSAIKQFDGAPVLLKMVGQNASVEVAGYMFTQINPFNFMSSGEAQDIIDFYPEKFRLAHPKEAKDFYN